MLKDVRKHDVILFCSNGQDSAILGMMAPTGEIQGAQQPQFCLEARQPFQ